MNVFTKMLFFLVLLLFLVHPAPAAVAGSKPLGFAPKKNSNQLVIYFHAMDGETHEPYLQPTKGAAIIDGIKQSFPGAGFLSLDYNPSLVLSGDFKDIDDTISAYKKDFPNISIVRLCGSSFGAYTALSYFACAREDIKPLIKGIVAISVPDDLDALARTSADKSLCHFLGKEFALSKQPNYLKRRSLSQIYKSVEEKTPVFILTMKHDTIVPAASNKDLETNLKARGFNVKLYKKDGEHGFPPLYFYEQGFRFIKENDKTLY